ncbi:MAG: VTT domain-containing protein [Gammaproteobacteria bacterium]|nr:VTT domain-containing protein [Gammaproteobacteria bacterium]
MVEALEFLTAHGYLIIFVWMFADQVALPLPAIPVLVGAGALSATGDLDLALVIVLAVTATLMADLIWYWLGKRRGGAIIAFLCKLALEPVSCVTKTRLAFGRYGPGTIVFAKYVPGLQTLAPASAGVVGAPLLGFVALDLAGALLFVVPFTLAGYVFHTQLASVLEAAAGVTGGIVLVVVGILLAYGIVKAWQWRAFVKTLRLRRLTVEDLKQRLDDGETLTIVDLRQKFDYEVLPEAIPGSTRIPLDEMTQRHDEIPRDHDIVLYCT